MPQKIEEHNDRTEWGPALGNFLSQLYDCSEPEAQAIHDLAWTIHHRASQADITPLQCHPNDLRDLLRSLPNHKAAGKDGVPSQVLKDLPFHQIKKLAALFDTLANDPVSDHTTVPTSGKKPLSQ